MPWPACAPCSPPAGTGRSPPSTPRTSSASGYLLSGEVGDHRLGGGGPGDGRHHPGPGELPEPAAGGWIGDLHRHRQPPAVQPGRHRDRDLHGRGERDGLGVARRFGPSHAGRRRPERRQLHGDGLVQRRRCVLLGAASTRESVLAVVVPPPHSTSSPSGSGSPRPGGTPTATPAPTTPPSPTTVKTVTTPVPSGGPARGEAAVQTAERGGPAPTRPKPGAAPATPGPLDLGAAPPVGLISLVAGIQLGGARRSSSSSSSPTGSWRSPSCSPPAGGGG